MKIYSTILCASALFFGFSAAAYAQSSWLTLPRLSMCDPFIENIDDDTQEEDTGLIETARKRLYDQELRETMTSEEAVMEALFEEKWDLATREPIPRTDFCKVEPNYIIHWADMISRTADGKTVLLAEGQFSFKKDGTFEFTFNKRPYVGNWKFDSGMMILQADWINNGESVKAPVEKVQTPVEVKLSDGTTETYYEDAHRVGWLRFLRSETTVRGQYKDCACSQ